MKHLWLFFLPLLFLPDQIFEYATPFGTLKSSDFFIGPYLILVYFAGRSKKRLMVNRLTFLMIVFIFWAMLSTISISFRYDYYASNYHIYFGLFKLAKFALYGLAGVLTVKTLTDDRLKAGFHWSLLGAGILVGVGLLVSRSSIDPWITFNEAKEQLYLENIVSVMMSMLIVYLLALRLTGYGSPRWRHSASVGLIVMILGWLLSNGRGGWLAGLVGIFYLLYRLGLKRLTIALALGAGLIIVAYFQFPVFQKQVDKTLWPDQAYLIRYGAGIAGVDDGARLTTWLNEGAKFFHHPILGTGFFHRGGQSGLWSTGSHNFFLQMFLETGMVGGVLVLLILWRMWRQAGTKAARQAGREIPVKVALLAAFVVGLGGEYFYGGMVLFTLLAVYGVVGAIPYSDDLKPAWTKPVPRPEKNSTAGEQLFANHGQ